MAKGKTPTTPGSAVTPPSLPETTPGPYPGSDYSFTLQGVFELKGSVSKLEGTVEHLTAAVEEQKTTLNGVQRLLWIATGAVIVASAITGFFLSKAWDMLDQSLHHRHALCRCQPVHIDHYAYAGSRCQVKPAPPATPAY